MKDSPKKDGLKVVGEVVQIPVDKIRPNLEQGRKFFDPVKLDELAESLKKEGQEVPVEVRRKDGFYEIIKGERRWRAAKIAKLEFLEGIIKEGISDKQAKRKSTVDNFGREGHTTLETMDLIASDLLEMKNDLKRPADKKTMEVMIGEIAKSFSKKPAWVYQHLRLFDLHADVRKLLDPKLPKGKGINFSTGLAIAKFPDKLKQLEMANKVVKGKMTTNEAEHHCRIVAEKAGIQYGERKRKPSDDLRVIQSFVNRTSNQVDRYLDMCKRNGTAEKLFKDSKTMDKSKFILEIKSCGERLKELADALH